MRLDKVETQLEFQSLTGFPGHSDLASGMKLPSVLKFQSLTGFPGHSDIVSAVAAVPQQQLLFQSLTGFPGHSDAKVNEPILIFIGVSIPNGLPRPFRHRHEPCPTLYCNVSIPNGLPRPFRRIGSLKHPTTPKQFQSLTGFPGHSDVKQSIMAAQE